MSNAKWVAWHKVVAIATILKLFLVLELQIKMWDNFLTDGIAALQVAEFARC
jgi:hypothetical protein